MWAQNCCEFEQESVKPNDTSMHTLSISIANMCSSVWFSVQNTTHQQLFEFHLKFVPHSTYILSENIYLSHIGPSIHPEIVQMLARARTHANVCCVPKITAMVTSITSMVFDSQIVDGFRIHTHAHTRARCAWLEFSSMDEFTKLLPHKMARWVVYSTYGKGTFPRAQWRV